MDHSAIIELLDHYFNGRPPSEEDHQKIKEFRKKDPKFEATYKEYELRVEGIRAFRRAELKANLRKHLQKNPVPETAQEAAPIAATIEKVAPTKIRKIQWSRWRNIAAACLVLLTFAGIHRYQTHTDRLYAAFAPDRISLIEAGENSTQEEDLKFEESRRLYAEGTQLGEQLASEQEAIEKLQRIPAEINYYYFWGQYEIALIYLKNGKKAAAREQVKKIMNREGEHIAKERARQLLDKINNWIL